MSQARRFCRQKKYQWCGLWRLILRAVFASSPAGGKDDAVADKGRMERRPSQTGKRPQPQRSGLPRKRNEPPVPEGRKSPERLPRPGLVRKPNEPPVPEGLDLRALHRSVRAELRGLPKELADIVAAHLIAAGQLLDDDPELAYAHAEAARRRAARLPIVREAAAETAYAAGHYDAALSELRAIRRMTGANDYLPMMADCERALGRPEAALKLAKEARQVRLDPAQRVEMILVEAGARGDLGQSAEALRILAEAADQLHPPAAPPIALARLRYAYADALLDRDASADARTWFQAAAKLDPHGETDAQARLDELDGLVLNVDETDLEPPSAVQK
jgi:tetratricopeptide (TPR) repeat protein